MQRSSTRPFDRSLWLCLGLLWVERLVLRLWKSFSECVEDVTSNATYAVVPKAGHWIGVNILQR